jgi:hypothetical protein
LLRDGRVLITGGLSLPRGSTKNVTLATAEVYDPATGEFTLTGSLSKPRYTHAAALLPDGRVLIAGGSDGTSGTLAAAEVVDPSTGTFSTAGTMILTRNAQSALYATFAISLSSGNVLVIVDT